LIRNQRSGTATFLPTIDILDVGQSLLRRLHGVRVKVLFWNYNVAKGSLMTKESVKADPLARMVNGRAIDLVVLADCGLSDTEILNAFIARGLNFTALAIPHPKVRFFRRSTSPRLVHVTSDDRFHFVRLTAEGFEEILIGATHLYDRQNTPLPQSRHSKASRHMTTLFEAELQAKHNRTILVGDFNMTPEEAGMVDRENSFGALMSWDLAKAQSAPELQEAPRFFNPMWSLMGRAGAPGTYYWDSTDSHNIYWFCIDGVIARHSLREIFRDETLEILTTIPDRDGEEVPLFRLAEKHWKIDFSDHLPIRFELELKPNQAGATS